jgi:hypothetical protein
MNKISWSKSIPFFKNTILLRGVFFVYLTVILIVSIIIASIFIIDGDGYKLIDIALPMMGVFLFIFILLFISTWITIGSQYAIQYTIGQDGITLKGLKDKASDIQKLAIMAGVLTANPGLMGAGMLVKKDVIHIQWDEIEDLLWKTDRNWIEVKCSLWYKVAMHYPKSKERDLEEVLAKYWQKKNTHNYV